MSHHTKDKGDLGVGMVIADLMKNGFGVFIPISEHLPYDLIAVNPTGMVKKVQVKFISLRDGQIKLDLRRCHADGNGFHKSSVDRSTFDAYALYCPEKGRVYYVRTGEIPDSSKSAFAMRFDEPKNRQKKLIHLAYGFEGAIRIFSECPRGAIG